MAGADSAQAVRPGGGPPAGRGASVQPDPVLSPSIKPAGSQQPRPDLQQQPPGQTDPQGLQGLSVQTFSVFIVELI